MSDKRELPNKLTTSMAIAINKALEPLLGETGAAGIAFCFVFPPEKGDAAGMGVVVQEGCSVGDIPLINAFNEVGRELIDKHTKYGYTGEAVSAYDTEGNEHLVKYHADELEENPS